MLVLMRKVREILVIGGNAEITIQILSVNGNQVNLGIVAPKEIPVNRLEIHERIQQEKATGTTYVKTTKGAKV